jgi:hypothetical protein
MSCIQIRGYTEHDLDALKKLHARQGFDYPFPDLSNPLFISKLVLEVENSASRRSEGLGATEPECSGPGVSTVRGSLRDRASESCGARERTIVMAALARLTCETYLLVDAQAGTPRDRYVRLLALHRAAQHDLRARGLEDAHAWLPPQIARRFGRRLEMLGWVRDDSWTPYCHRL